jgi:hypothetical protein
LPLVGKTERFKTYLRNIRGWPALCKPAGAQGLHLQLIHVALRGPNREPRKAVSAIKR